MDKIKTRFAPSPTGYLHIGGLRTALYSFAFAKSKGGNFLLRIEDTDRSRFVPGATERIYEILKIFNLNWDEGPLVGGPNGPYVQSERAKEGIYQNFAQKLVDEGHAYYCFCPPQTKEEIKKEHEGKKISLRDEACRSLSKEEIEKKLKRGIKPAIRLKVPEKEKISFKDFVLRKEVTWESENIDEVMLLKSDGFPTYHLAVVVDDYLMGITHIIRGRDWLPSTPVHLLLFKYLDFSLPEIGHLTDILDPGGGKLSKRKGTVSVEEFLKEGYLPEALLNFIMLLGWAPKDNREIFSLKEFVENFEKGDLQISNPVFNRVKLDWFNGHYIRQKADEELVSLLEPFAPKDAERKTMLKITSLIKDRLVKLSDFKTYTGFFFETPEVDPCLFKDLPYNEHLSEAVAALKEIENWNNEEIQKTLGKLIEKKGWKTGDFYMSFRVALTGSRFTPPVTESAEILGKEETLKRLENLL
ncbi:glutamate--tRNA ligase [Candidatus Microgenomates bacterium]|jgi:glutamyl-tRNA synthetase|nr:MAG: glutamate--tRNA ligase [Candidatus Microgenomates bacterium]